jgi:hypothetical protein
MQYPFATGWESNVFDFFLSGSNDADQMQTWQRGMAHSIAEITFHARKYFPFINLASSWTRTAAGCIGPVREGNGWKANTH